MRNALFATALVVTLLVGALGLPPQASASQSRVSLKLEIMGQINGTITDQSPEVTYSVDLNAGQMFSVQAWPTSGDLQIDVMVSSPVGAQLAQSAVLNQASGLSGIEGIIADQDGSYSIMVQRAGQTAGDFSLIVLPGYGSLEVWDQFDGTGDYALTWCGCETEDYLMGVVDGQYMIEVRKPQSNWSMRPDEIINWEDFYAEASVQFGSTHPRGYGFIFRAVPRDNDIAYYLVFVNSDGRWGIKYSSPENADWVIIAETQDSPVIDLTDPNPRIGLLVQGFTFTLFFNGQMVGQATDTAGYLPAGELGILASTKDEAPAQAYFDELVITTPLAPDSESAGPASLTGILDGAGVEENAEVPFGLGQKLERDMLPSEDRPLPLPAVTD